MVEASTSTKKGDVVIGVMQNWSRAEGPFEFLECFLGAGTPEQGLGLCLEHGGQRSCMLTEILDETSIEIGKSLESLNLLYQLKSRPLRDCSNLPLVHLDSLMSDDITKELYRGAMELTFLQFEV